MEDIHLCGFDFVESGSFDKIDEILEYWTKQTQKIVPS